MQKTETNFVVVLNWLVCFVLRQPRFREASITREDG